ncbi:MAG: hypothetical protein K0V04_45095 [Deltaproteobacteria bacterium]|nr:hypothetical protein [Deltaproteobacteria bacterium]
MRRGHWLWAWALGLGVGCTQDAAEPNSSGFGPGPWTLPGTAGAESDDAQSDESDEDPGATSMPGDGADTGTQTSGPMSTSGNATGDPEPMGTTDDGMSGTFGDDAGMQPASGWWAHCIPDQILCDPGFACLSTDAMNDGVCTDECIPAGNAGSCGASPGGTATPVCLTVGGASVCALGCDNGATCPGGMVCINESDDTGPISICI